MEQLLPALPFVGVLCSFAILPGAAPRFWRRHTAGIIIFWVAAGLILQSELAGIFDAGQALWQVSFGEFLPFITLLLALYALGGGIAIQGGPWGRPAGNLLLLTIGTFLASVMGTVGASLLLIHPLLASNGHRAEKRHLVMAFIILVGNVGGALSPLGDPPLLVGFLRGVPFLWPIWHLWRPFLVLALPVLAICYGLDVYLSRQEAKREAQKLRVRGVLNIILLFFLTLAIPLEGVWHPGKVIIFGGAIAGQQLALTLLALACIALSEWATPHNIRRQNRFAWEGMREIVLLFFAIFATISPVFGLLRAAALAPDPLGWFWASGVASAILDAAPTYLIFFEAAGGHAASLSAAPARLLSAIAAGSVFFGPVTYLGNAPNLMLREIAAHRGVRMPGFFAFAGIMVVTLAPLYILIGWLFFSS